MNEKLRALKSYAYYILIGIISFISVAFLPMLNSEVNIEYELPKTVASWSLWLGTRISISLLNVLIFHCFVKQGDTNTKNNPNRIKAEELLMIVKEEQIKLAQSPKHFLSHEYLKKIPTILLSTLLSLLAFGQAIFQFDVVTFTTYLFTCITSLVFGIIEMFKVEEYYEKEYLLYAQRKKKEQEELQKEELTAKDNKKNEVFTPKVIDFQYLGKER